MKAKFLLSAGVAVMVFVVFKSSHAADNDAVQAAQIKRGQYLVERVGMCADCHTPRTQTGELDRESWLKGAVLDFKPTHPVPSFALMAPPIAGLPTLPTDAQATRFLETGTNAAGKLANPPMPPVRLDHEDALAVTTYLRSLKK